MTYKELLNGMCYDCKFYPCQTLKGGDHCCTYNGLAEAIERCNLVGQYRWERDIALEQLNKIGCGLGQIKKTLKKADKYRWHDLRKNPDDLPKAIGDGYESDYVLVMIGTPEWNSWEQAYYHHGKRLWSTYEQNVFAWRYIEPFEEEE